MERSPSKLAGYGYIIFRGVSITAMAIARPEEGQCAMYEEDLK